MQTAPIAPRLEALYERMLLIRRVEERLSQDKLAGKLPGAVHLCIGQEAAEVGICDHLTDTDRITSTHRGHGHFLAKGGDVKAMVAEVWGKRTGICLGMGGSMHVADVSKGILGANGIVGGGFAIATGAAFAAKLDGKGRVSVCFFGDGASNQGVLMETLNVSKLWELPTIFICENNGFSEFTPGREVTAGEIADRARAFGIATEVVDGNDIQAVWEAGERAVARGRRGEGPTFIEATTYRFHGHTEAEKGILGGGTYRDDAEVESWRPKCPVTRLRARLTDNGAAVAVASIEERVRAIVDDASTFAETSEPADLELALGLMFHDQAA